MSIRIRVSTVLALVLALPFWLAGPAQATPVQFLFSGTLNSVTPGLPLFQVGNPFSGTFTYESSTTANPGSIPQQAFYNALTDFTVTIQIVPNAITFSTSKSAPSGAPNSVVIENHEAGGGGIDVFRVQALPPFSGSNLPLFLVTSAVVALQDNSASVFGPDDTIVPLPTSLNLSQFSSELFGLNFANSAGDQFQARGPLNNLVRTPVPEPTTLLLFGSTIAVLGLARWARRRLN